MSKLRRIEAAEEFLKREGFEDVRVRHLGGDARVEVPATDVDRLSAIGDRVRTALSDLGFESVRLDPRGLVSGRLNQEQGVARPAERT